MPEVDELPRPAAQVPHRPGGLPALRARPETLSRGRGPSPARRASSTASAASRSRTSPATSTTSRPTTSTWSTCGPRRSRGSPTTSRTSRSTATRTGELLVLGWGSTSGAIHGAVSSARRLGLSVSHVHLRHLNPLPKNLGEVLERYDRVLVPEMNLGQLALLLRGPVPDGRHHASTRSRASRSPVKRSCDKIQSILERQTMPTDDADADPS